MRKWKRVDTAAGPRLRSALAAHEAALLRDLVTSLGGLFDERESAWPTDELEEITGMRTGHQEPPEDATLRRLLPDFHRPSGQGPPGSVDADSLNRALRSLHEPEILERQT